MKTQRFVLGLISILFLGGVFASIFAKPLPKTDRWNPRTIPGSRSYLGVVVRNVPHRFQVHFKLEPDEGAYVTRVEEDSPADTAGILEGDIILKIDGHRVRGAGDFVRSIQRHRPGDEITLEILENGERWNVKVTLARAARDQSFYFGFPDWGFKNRWQKAWLGVKLQSLDEDLAKYFHVDESDGVLIVSVVPESPAKQAGLKSGDILSEVAGEHVETPEDVQDVLSDFRPGDRVTLKIIRQGKERTVKVRLGQTSSGYPRGYFRFE